MVSLTNLKILKDHIYIPKNHSTFYYFNTFYIKIFKEEESIEILKIICLIENTQLLLNMLEENISQELSIKNIDETRNCFLEEIKQNELMSRKHQKFVHL